MDKQTVLTNPLEIKVRQPLKYEYFQDQDILEIEGKRYSGDLFRKFGIGQTLDNECLKILSSPGKSVILQVIIDHTKPKTTESPTIKPKVAKNPVSGPNRGIVKVDVKFLNEDEVSDLKAMAKESARILNKGLST